MKQKPSDFAAEEMKVQPPTDAETFVSTRRNHRSHSIRRSKRAHTRHAREKRENKGKKELAGEAKQLKKEGDQQSSRPAVPLRSHRTSSALGPRTIGIRRLARILTCPPPPPLSLTFLLPGFRRRPPPPPGTTSQFARRLSRYPPRPRSSLPQASLVLAAAAASLSCAAPATACSDPTAWGEVPPYALALQRVETGPPLGSSTVFIGEVCDGLLGVNRQLTLGVGTNLKR